MSDCLNHQFFSWNCSKDKIEANVSKILSNIQNYEKTREKQQLRQSNILTTYQNVLLVDFKNISFDQYRSMVRKHSYGLSDSLKILFYLTLNNFYILKIPV